MITVWRLFVFLSFLSNPFPLFAKQETLARPDTTMASRAPVAKVKSVQELIPSYAVASKGLLDIYSFDNKYYLGVPKKLLNRDILCVTRIAKGAVNSTLSEGKVPLYSGDELNNMVIDFRKRDNKLFIEKRIFTDYTDSSKSMAQSVARSSYAPIIASFPIEASAGDTVYMINVTTYIMDENELFGLSTAAKAANKLTSLATDKSYVSSLHSYKTNVEITATKTYAQAIPQSIGGDGWQATATFNGFFTCEINTSWILLPDKPMKQRLSDFRVGYFFISQKDFDSNPNGMATRNYIKRWNLQPREEDRKRYEAGELVEPENPIVFYIDPATPGRWVPYLIQGVNDWQKAFEAAGFKNAIFARTPPTQAEDSTWSLYDARHSAIVYKPSEIENARGPNIVDPRSGEILESHIDWYHNVMELIHDWYMVQCGAVDPKARKMVFDDSLMGQLIRFVSSHEVGHTLGLMHNMMASSSTPVEKLRDKAWVEAHGHTSSIMDYARFNYVAQPEDNISESGLFPRIGDYDRWAIEWGYKLIPSAPTSEQEQIALDSLVRERTKDKKLLFGLAGDPRKQTEDLSDDAVRASEYGIKNLKRIIPKLIYWTQAPLEGYENLDRLYGTVQAQFQTYLTHVMSNIGGRYENTKRNDQSGPVFELVPYEKQKQAVNFFIKNVCTTPVWLLDTVILSRTGQVATGVIGDIQEFVFRNLFFGGRLAKMASLSKVAAYKTRVYSLNDMFSDLKKSVWEELATHEPIDIYRRSLQKKYVRSLLDVYATTGMSTNISLMTVYPFHLSRLQAGDMLATLFGHLRDLQSDIRKSIPNYKDEETKYHLQYLVDKIDQTFTNLKNNKIY